MPSKNPDSDKKTKSDNENSATADESAYQGDDYWHGAGKESADNHKDTIEESLEQSEGEGPKKTDEE